MNDIQQAWERFVQSGKIDDYISYAQSKAENVKGADNAAENQGRCAETAQYR